MVPYGIQLIWHMGFLLSAIILELYFMNAISKTRSGFTQWNGFWQMETGGTDKAGLWLFLLLFLLVLMGIFGGVLNGKVEEI